MKYLLFLLLPFASIAQTRDTTKAVLINKDTLLTIKVTTPKTGSLTYSYNDVSVLQVTKPFQSPPVIDTVVTPPPPAQTGVIQGFASGATGGAGKAVVRVTNLNQSGAGSLSAALGSNRTIVFDVAGTIIGRFYVGNMSNLTIDGFSAPSPGITIDNRNNGDGISVEGSTNVIVQGLRVHNAGNDCINVVASNTVAILNCTAWNAADGDIDIASDAQNVTVQYCILGYGKSGWGGGMLVTARNVTVHHNLFVTTGGGKGERNPLAHSNYTSVGSPNIDFVNNIVYKWDGYGTAICYNSTGNVINNYYFSNTSPGKAINKSDGYGNGNTGKVYASGNIGSSFVGVSGQFTIPAVNRVVTQSACEAAKLVLAGAGTKYQDSNEKAFKASVVLTGCP